MGDASHNSTSKAEQQLPANSSSSDGEAVSASSTPAGPRTNPAWKGWVRELLITGAIVAVVLLVVGGMRRERQRGGGGELEVASAAPTFMFEHLDGKVASSESLRGKPTVLVFWATWCGVCTSEMPDLERFAAAARGRYNVVALSHEAPNVLRRWSADHPSALSIAHDVGGRASEAYKVESLPTHVIIDAAGRVVHDFSGAADPEILREHVEGLLTGADGPS